MAKVLKCPVCVCGETVDSHGSTTDPPSPTRAFAVAEKAKSLRPCPGKDTQLRHGAFRQDEPVARQEWFGLLVPVIGGGEQADEQIDEPAGPPQVPARAPQGPHELAGGGGGKQATKLGRNATGLGWRADALYWRAVDGTEGCGVWLVKGPLRAVATWKRKPGQAGGLTGWVVDVAYAWRTDIDGRFPTKLTHTELEGLIK